ncbi:MAG: hypothetical protein WBD27_02955 [Pyrinomonadaceae bacterium]
MKTIFRFLSLGAVLTAFVAVGTTASYAQEACADVDGQTALYTKFTEIYAKKTAAELKPALATGKEFLEKYGACETLKDQIAFVQPQVQRIEKLIPDLEKAEKLKPLFARYDAGINGDNADEVYAAGKEILALMPDNVNIMVPMGVVGTYQSNSANNYKYANDGIQYASIALSKIKGGWEFTKKNKGVPTVGALKYEYTKQEVIDELTYALAYLNYYGKKDKKTAVPLYYELSQSSGRYKDDPRIYGTIADNYREQGGPLGDEIATLIKDRKDTDAPEVLAQKEAGIKAKVALFNGYTERALDAYIRAHKVAKSDTPAAKSYKENLYKIIQDLYKRRFDKDTGVDAYIVATVAKPFPNPTSEVTPVSDPEPATTTTTTTVQPTKPATTGQPVKAAPATAVTKPVSDAKPKASTPAKTPSATTVAVKTKPVAKKPIAKKKGKV